jgi:hypothetical protein
VTLATNRQSSAAATATKPSRSKGKAATIGAADEAKAMHMPAVLPSKETRVLEPGRREAQSGKHSKPAAELVSKAAPAGKAAQQQPRNAKAAAGTQAAPAPAAQQPAMAVAKPASRLADQPTAKPAAVPAAGQAFRSPLRQVNPEATAPATTPGDTALQAGMFPRVGMRKGGGFARANKPIQPQVGARVAGLRRKK